MKLLIGLTLLTLVVFLFQVKAKVLNYTGRIHNGDVAMPGQFPYIVYLEMTLNTETNACGGTLIGKNWVLTSAHCLEDIISFTVYLGSINKDDAEVAYTLDKSSIFPHPDWNPDSGISNIALIQIPTTEYCAKISPAPLPKLVSKYSTYADEYAIAAGWGMLGNTGPYSDVLLWASMKVISNEDCAYLYDIFPSELCTKETAAHCPGDSGGPLILETTGELIGVIDSMSQMGCQDGEPVLYTRVTYFLDWIKSKTGISY